MVKPGIYTFRLTKNQKEYASQIELKPDKLTAHSAEDREKRHQAIMEVYVMLEHLAYLVDTMKEMETNLRAVIEKGDKTLSGSTKKFLRERTEYLSGVRETIVGKSMYDSTRLQSLMIGLYSSMSRYAGRPSNSQLTYITTLKKALSGVDEIFNTFIERTIPDVNRRLQKAKIAVIKVASEEEYREKIKE
jgi:hypothetical protein